jgi:2-polyprenyl-3-methyl-5-hydroxy-6-metoxy-1,4-benzoquinol methylase
MNFLKDIYEQHHKDKKRVGFSILEKERGRLLKNFIGTGKKILDLGCRDGTLTKYYVDGNQVLGVDIDATALEIARKNLGVETLEMDLNRSWEELGDKIFDVIVAGEVLEHLYYPERVIKKIKERLNRGGIFIGSVPNAFSLKNRVRYFLGKKQNTPLEDPTHINHFSYKELRNLLSRNFKEITIIGLGRYKLLAKIFPNLFAFDLFFVCKDVL